jgi:hypothetical protein
MRSRGALGQKASSSFLKKRTKKLLSIGVRVAATRTPYEQKFLLLFPKRSAFLLPSVNFNAGCYETQ